MFANTTIPIFFSEYGCNKPEGVPRVFNEVAALYGEDMTSLSGGLVYEYSQEESDFGLVVINDNSTVSLKKDYDNLQGHYNNLDISLIESTNPSQTSKSPPECGDSLISDSGFSKNFTIPDPPSGASDLINNGIKNPTNGKLVDVKETNVPMAVYGSTGVQIQNLAIRKLPNDQSNTPSNETTSPSGTAAPSPTASKKGGAGRAGVEAWGLGVAGLAVLLALL
jgi:hypothetical protein